MSADKLQGFPGKQDGARRLNGDPWPADRPAAPLPQAPEQVGVAPRPSDTGLEFWLRPGAFRRLNQ